MGRAGAGSGGGSHSSFSSSHSSNRSSGSHHVPSSDRAGSSNSIDSIDIGLLVDIAINVIRIVPNIIDFFVGLKAEKEEEKRRKIQSQIEYENFLEERAQVKAKYGEYPQFNDMGTRMGMCMGSIGGMGSIGSMGSMNGMSNYDIHNTDIEYSGDVEQYADTDKQNNYFENLISKTAEDSQTTGLSVPKLSDAEMLDTATMLVAFTRLSNVVNLNEGTAFHKEHPDCNPELYEHVVNILKSKNRYSGLPSITNWSNLWMRLDLAVRHCEFFTNIQQYIDWAKLLKYINTLLPVSEGRELRIVVQVLLADDFLTTFQKK